MRRTTAIIGNNYLLSNFIQKTLLSLNSENEIDIVLENEIINYNFQEKEIEVFILVNEMQNVAKLFSLKKLFPNAVFIKACSFEDIAKHTSDTEYFGYLPLPVTTERIIALYKNIDLYYQTKNKLTSSAKEYVFIKSDYKLVKVKLADIMYIAGMKDYTQVYLKSKPNPIITLQNLRDFESKLPPEKFIRIHRSYIISMDAVDIISRNEVTVGKHSIPIGESFKQKLLTLINQC